MKPGILNLKAVISSLLLLCVALVSAPATAQKPSPMQNVTVVVVNAHVQPAQPVPTVRVSLSYVDNGIRVTQARDVTNPRGEAYLTVAKDAAQRGDLRLEISGVTDLVIYRPADGQLNGLPSNVKVELLPKGSPALLGPTQIEALLHRTLLQVNSQQRQIQALKNQKPDLSAALAEVAQAYGFAPADFDKQVQQWAQQVQADPAADARKKALAEVALNHYAEAAQLFTQATNADASDMDTDEKKFLEERRTKLRQLITDAQQSADASQLNLQYRQATATLEAARDRAAAEERYFPDDKALHRILLDVTLAVAIARWSEGVEAPSSQGLPLLAQAANDFQTLAREYLVLGDRADWAATQNNLGVALLVECKHASGDQAALLIDQAVQAFHSALEVHTKADFPLDWGAAQSNLGVALRDEGERASGDQASGLFEQAVQAFRNAFEVDTKADHPHQWATDQKNLGLTLMREGERTGDDKSAELFGQAVQAFRSALEVDTKADLPQRWAGTQGYLGMALVDEGERANGDTAPALFDQAVQTFREALEVQTRSDLPQEWAATQQNIGVALMDEGERTSGDKAAALFDQAVQAFRSALGVDTKPDLPQDWAATQSNLGNALSAEGERASADNAAVLFDQAVQCYRNALDVRTKADLPQDWASTQYNLGTALLEEGVRADVDKAAALFDQAEQAYRNVLEIVTKSGDPYHWGRTMHNLAVVYYAQGNIVSAQQALADANSVDPQ
jgi:tetratricopeptide (TPR) repeat protein